MSDEEIEEMLDVPFVFWTCPSGCRGAVVWSPRCADAECTVCGRKRSDGPVVTGDQQRNKTKDGWISVKDRLPTEDGLYLGANSRESFPVTCTFLDGKPFWEDMHEGRIEVTHWMPLPGRPEAS